MAAGMASEATPKRCSHIIVPVRPPVSFLRLVLCLLGVVTHGSPQETGATGVGAGPLPAEANALPQQTPCGMLSNLQDAVLQVMTAHYEYGHGIHHLHGLVSQLQLDLTDLKAQLLQLEQLHEKQAANKDYKAELKELANKGTELDTAENLATVKGKPPSAEHSPAPAKELLKLTAAMETVTTFLGDYIKPFNASSSLHGLVRNVTERLSVQESKMGGLQRRVHGLRRQIKQATNIMSAWEKTFKVYDSRMISHMLDKQREINTGLERRLAQLEGSVKGNDARLPEVADTAKPAAAGGPCPVDFVRHASSCYLFGNVTAHWVDAEKHCQRRHVRAHLVAIETESEHDFIVMYRQYNAVHWTSYYVWTGGTNMLDGGGWRWVSTQRPLSYSRWRPGKPSARVSNNNEQHCLYFPTAGSDSKWDDWHCYAARLNFVCEILV